MTIIIGISTSMDTRIAGTGTIPTMATAPIATYTTPCIMRIMMMMMSYMPVMMMVWIPTTIIPTIIIPR
jgi:uncharacterized RDD family membrane protein YckC